MIEIWYKKQRILKKILCFIVFHYNNFASPERYFSFKYSVSVSF